MVLIGLGCRKRVGKNQAAEFIKAELESLGFTVEVTSFAEPLYRVAHILYGWAGFGTKEFYENNPKYKEVLLPEIGKTPRQILIDLGTPAIRDRVYDETWVKLLTRSKHDSDFVIVTDLRFPNELKAIRDVNGYTVRIDRPSIPKDDDIADSAMNDVEDSAWFSIITNDGNLDKFKGQVCEVLTLILENLNLKKS